MQCVPRFLARRSGQEKCDWNFLVVQWLRIHLPMQGDMGSIPDTQRSHMPQNNEASAQQLLKPVSLKPMLHNKKSHCDFFKSMIVGWTYDSGIEPASLVSPALVSRRPTAVLKQAHLLGFLPPFLVPMPFNSFAPRAHVLR